METTAMNINQQKIENFAQQVLFDASAATAAVMINIGHELGLFKALDGAGPLTSEQVAKRSGCYERYVEEWLKSMVAGGYIVYNEALETYELPIEHSFVLVNQDSPAYLSPAFKVVASLWFDRDKLMKAFKSGEGISWGSHNHNLFFGTEAFYRTGYKAQLISQWIPSLTDIEEKLLDGGKVADIGCGHGASTILMAEAFPKSEFIGYDTHEKSLEVARNNAEERGLTNVQFIKASAWDFKQTGFDLICYMDAFHDFGHPDKAAKLAYKALNDSGSVMLVEPMAGDNLSDNINPVSRMFYSASTALCVPHAHSENGKYCLGAQAGKRKLAEILKDAGFKTVRTASTTPVNLILESKKS